MDQDLARYLNDHLAGSSGALLLIQELADGHDAPEAKGFFLDLKENVEADRFLLEDLLERIGQSPSALLKITGGIAARISGIKLRWEQIEPGKLGLFEALEMLALGLYGKHLLWVALGEIASRIPEWNDIDFGELVWCPTNRLNLSHSELSASSRRVASCGPAGPRESAQRG